MKRAFWKSLALAAIMTVNAPAFAHVGHGDEFEATGDAHRVEVNSETDSQLGIQVASIEPAADGGAAVLIPATALVNAADKTYVFVQYENFYEPVEVVTGDSQGDFIEITEGLSVGEQLVIQGGLSLYAQSRRAQDPEFTESSSLTEATTKSSFPLPSIFGLVGLVSLAAVGGTLFVASNGKRR